MNSYNARMLANIVKWIRDNRKDVPFVYDEVNYTLTIRMDSIFIERNGEINQGVHLEDRRFKWPDGLLEVIWKEIEKIRLNEIATKLENQLINEISNTKRKEQHEIKDCLKEETSVDYRKLLLDELNKHWGDFNVLARDSNFMTTDAEKYVTWVIEHLQEIITGITHNRITCKYQMQKVKEYLQDKEYVITEVEIIKYISSKLPTFKANEYPNLANVIELILGTEYYDSSDLTQTFVKVKEFFEKNRYKELYEILKG